MSLFFFQRKKTKYIYVLLLVATEFNMHIQYCEKKSNSYVFVLTQCARIRVPLVVMKIEKFKDLFRAALDRW